MSKKNNKTFLIILIIIGGGFLSYTIFFTDYLFVKEKETEAQAFENYTEKQEEFNPGKYIIDHVTDKYEWHIAGSREKPISIPLPVILYTREKGLDIFLSNKLKHGASYHGYTLNQEEHIETKDNYPFYDFSITKAVICLFIASCLVLFIFISVAKNYAHRKGQAPKGFQSLIEPFILFVRDDIAKQSIGEKYYAKFLPFLLTLFFFIWICNCIGLFPTFPGLMGNISVTFTLASIVLLITLFIGNKHYWKHILWMPGVPAWVKIFILTPIEIIGVFQRPFVLMIRIFANIAAGHIVILSFVFLIFIFGNKNAAGGWGFSPVSMTFAVFMNAMELLVAFLQAYVFTLLTALYIGSCVEEPNLIKE